MLHILEMIHSRQLCGPGPVNGASRTSRWKWEPMTDDTILLRRDGVAPAMRAWQVGSVGEPRDVMSLVTIDRPVPASGQVLIKVSAAAANFPDVLMCRGTYQVRPALPFTPGVEACGVVAAVGEGVSSCEVGDRVLGGPVLPHGGFAEYALLDGAQTFHAPFGLDDAQAASFYVGYQTGWFALKVRAALQPGETLLVHAAAGGVGSAAVQLGKALGARVIGVVGSASKVDVAQALGADIVVDRSTTDFVAVVNEATGGRGADVVFDPVGGETYQRSTKCIAFSGRIVVVGFAGGAIQTAALNHALVKNYSILGLHWGLYNAKAPGLVAECHADLSRMVAEGHVRPLVGSRIPLADVAEGLQLLADGSTVGRVAYVADPSTVDRRSATVESQHQESS